MNTVQVTMIKDPKLYIEAENIVPDIFAGKTTEEIRELPIYEGNRTYKLGEYFEVTGKPGETAADTKIEVRGESLGRVKWIGSRMTGGEVIIFGDSDMYTGAFMEGGRIEVKGNVGHFTALGMKNGEMIIEGNAGNYLGAAYRGDWRGMMDGVIRVGGNAGSDLATYMRGGEVVIGGNVDVHVGNHQEGGRIVIKGNAKSKVGGQMVQGDIFVFGTIDLMMPGFAYSEDAELEVDGTKETFKVYEGDLGERHPKKGGKTIYGHLYVKA